LKKDEKKNQAKVKGKKEKNEETKVEG